MSAEIPKPTKPKQKRVAFSKEEEAYLIAGVEKCVARLLLFAPLSALRRRGGCARCVLCRVRCAMRVRPTKDAVPVLFLPRSLPPAGVL